MHDIRKNLVLPYITEVEANNLPNLGNMEDIVWDAFYQSRINVYESRKEAERIAHVTRLAEEHRKKLYDDRKAELIEFWNFLDHEQKQMDFSKLSEKYYEGLLASLKIRKEQYDAEQQRLREENEVLRQKQKEAELERQRLNEELQKKEKEFREAEMLKQLEEEKARKEAKKLAKAPVKKQLMAWVKNFDIEDMPIHDQVAVDILIKFEAFKKWAITQVESI